MLRFRCFLTIYFSLFFGSMFVLCQELKSTPDLRLAIDQEAASYVNALALNAQGVRSYDVLLRYESFHDIGPEFYIRNVSLIRTRIDRDAEKMLVLKKQERRTRQTNEDEQRSISLEGVLFADKNLRIARFDGPIGQKKLSFSEAANYISLTDLRFVGLKPFPTSSSSLGKFEEYLAASKIFTNCRLQNVDTQNVEINRSIPTVNAPEEFSHSQWRFSTVTLMPTRFHKEIRRKESGLPVVYPTCRESYIWEEVNGSFVPARIDGLESGQLEIEKGRKPIRYQVENAAQFHWFTVNEHIDDNAFSAELLDSFGNCFKLLDPKMSGATTIVE